MNSYHHWRFNQLAPDSLPYIAALRDRHYASVVGLATLWYYSQYSIYIDYTALGLHFSCSTYEFRRGFPMTWHLRPEVWGHSSYICQVMQLVIIILARLHRCAPHAFQSWHRVLHRAGHNSVVRVRIGFEGGIVSRSAVRKENWLAGKILAAICRSLNNDRGLREASTKRLPL